MVAGAWAMLFHIGYNGRDGQNSTAIRSAAVAGGMGFSAGASPVSAVARRC